jgi:hypothetical protein
MYGNGRFAWNALYLLHAGEKSTVGGTIIESWLVCLRFEQRQQQCQQFQQGCKGVALLVVLRRKTFSWKFHGKYKLRIDTILGVRWNPEVSNQVWMHFKQIWMH